MRVTLTITNDAGHTEVFERNDFATTMVTPMIFGVVRAALAARQDEMTVLWQAMKLLGDAVSSAGIEADRG